MIDPDLKQRLAAILAADAAGYSRLMAIDERRTVAALDAARAVFRNQIECHQGRVIDMAGDSVLAIFETATGAISAALVAQVQINAIADAAGNDRGMRFRIGVHLGDVIEKPDGTIYGDGVNIAARLEGLAEPGGISVSESIRTAVKGKVAANFDDQGQQPVKNILDPVRSYRVRKENATTTVGDISGPSAPHSSANREIDLSLPDKPSIAVLPFTNLSGESEQEYFTDGVTEDIITELSRFHSLFVISRNSSFTYKGKAVDVRTVAKQLGVRYVLEGSIRRSGNRIRVTGQLIDALTGNHIWAEKYDRVLEDIFGVQEEVTRAIVRAIAPQIESVERSRAVRRRPANLSAYEFAVRAWANAMLAFFGMDTSLRSQSIREAKEALAIDPESTLALNAIAFAQHQNVLFRTTPHLEIAWSEGMLAAQRAIELDPSDSRGYASKGMLLCFPPHPPGTPGQIDRNDEALSDLQRAHELNPNDVFVLQLLGFCEAAIGLLPEAIGRLTQALRNSPRGPWSPNTASLLSTAYFFAKDYVNGSQWALRALNESPNLYSAQTNLAANYVGLGELDKAKTALEAARRIAPEFIESRLNGSFYSGRPEDRKRHHVFLRIAAGLEDPSAADALRR